MKIAQFLLFFQSFIGLYANPMWDYGVGFEYITEQMVKRAAGPNPLTETKWIQQPVDHFNNQDTRTWKMRYFENFEFFKPNGPIYLYIGGEGEAKDIFTGSVLYSLANETRGAMFKSEHRYYGQSIPLNPSEVENMKYLSSEQALADLAHLLKTIKSSPDFSQSKVAVIGGSYAGNLAAWMRVKYPDIVDAAWSSSAPVLAKKDYFEYLEKVAEDYKKYGGNTCYEKIVKIFQRYDKLLQSAEGIKQLKKEENICEKTDMTKPLNIAFFFRVVIVDYMRFAQNTSPDMIKLHCSNLLNNTEETRQYTSNKIGCFDYDFSNLSPTKGTQRWSWRYQTCTEFGYSQTTNSENQPFTKNLILDYYVKICPMAYGAEFDEKRMDKGIAYTNKQYGGLSPNVTKVVFVNGGMDPWSKLGILKDLSVDAPARVIPDHSHCQDIKRESFSDHKDLIETRKFAKTMIKKWLGISN